MVVRSQVAEELQVLRGLMGQKMREHASHRRIRSPDQQSKERLPPSRADGALRAGV